MFVKQTYKKFLEKWQSSKQPIGNCMQMQRKTCCNCVAKYMAHPCNYKQQNHVVGGKRIITTLNKLKGSTIIRQK
jgi:ribosomal protein S17E